VEELTQRRSDRCAGVDQACVDAERAQGFKEQSGLQTKLWEERWQEADAAVDGAQPARSTDHRHLAHRGFGSSAAGAAQQCRCRRERANELGRCWKTSEQADKLRAQAAAVAAAETFKKA